VPQREGHRGEGHQGDCRHLPIQSAAADPHSHPRCFRLPQLLAELAALGEVYAASQAPNAAAVRGCPLAAIMILGYSYEMHTYPVICITHMHVLFKWSATCSLAGVQEGRAKQGCFVHTWILCGTDVVITSGS
jgi:hypothetical protein